MMSHSKFLDSPSQLDSKELALDLLTSVCLIGNDELPTNILSPTSNVLSATNFKRLEKGMVFKRCLNSSLNTHVTSHTGG
jgi:hypothetical protein